MSHIAAWKAHGVVYIVGDTATTLLSPTPEQVAKLSRESTSFSERNISEPTKLVFEGTLKIINLGQLVVAFAGDIDTANCMVEAICDHLRDQQTPRAAFERAVLGFVPISREREVALIAAYPSEDKSTLLVFNESGQQHVTEVHEGHLTQIGNLPELERSFTRHFLKSTYFIQEEPSRILITAMAAMQSYGLRSTLLENGVGGTFTGVYVDADGVSWHEDVLIMLVDTAETPSGLITIAVRGNALISQSSRERTTRVFANLASCGPLESWMSNWSAVYDNLALAAELRYAVALPILQPTVLICDLAKPGVESHLRIHRLPPESPDEACRFELWTSQLFRNAVDHQPPLPSAVFGLQFFWFPPDAHSPN